MTLLQAAILGFVEGITEFLPISSTAHLIFASSFLGISQSEFLKLFEVVIQSGAICAVIILYFNEFLKNKQLLKSILLSFIPTALIGFIFHDIIKNVFFESQALIMSSFFIIALVFLAVEYAIKNKKLLLEKQLSSMVVKDALIIGVIQACAIVPGVSRAGAVIIAMLLLKYKRKDAALYSFFLAVPTIFAASALDIVKTDTSLFLAGQNSILLLVGFISAFVSAFLIIKWFIKYLQNNTLTPFAIYRILVAMAFFILVVTI